MRFNFASNKWPLVLLLISLMTWEQSSFGRSENSCERVYSENNSKVQAAISEDEFGFLDDHYFNVVDAFKNTTDAGPTIRFFDLVTRRYVDNPDVEPAAKKVFDSVGKTKIDMKEGSFIIEMTEKGSTLSVSIPVLQLAGMTLTESQGKGVGFGKVLSPIILGLLARLENPAIKKVEFTAADVVNYDLAMMLTKVGFKSKSLGRQMTGQEIEAVLGKNKNLVPKSTPFPKREDYGTDAEFESAMIKWERQKRAQIAARTRVDRSSVPIGEGVDSISFVQVLEVNF